MRDIYRKSVKYMSQTIFNNFLNKLIYINANNIVSHDYTI